jgi:N-acetylneuraminic acid mutarotase
MKNAKPDSLNSDGFVPVSCRADATRLGRQFLSGWLIVLASFCSSAAAQTNEWTWMGGSLTQGTLGVYGALSQPASGNAPGGRFGAVSWTDSQGNFWLFGGYGIASGPRAYYGYLNDLWEFNSATNEWTWMGGSSSLPNNFSAGAGVYGTLGTPAAGNIPPGRSGAVSWIDSTGNLWLFGGFSYSSIGLNYYSDVWKYSPTANEWTWVGGSNKANQAGVYGTIQKPAAGNMPGARNEAVSWTDSKGNLWLFGGDGYDSTGALQNLNDLWEYNPTTNQWTWMNGSSAAGQAGVPGTQGTPAQGNMPGARNLSSSWTDHQGNLWLFGGSSAEGNPGDPFGSTTNDLWEFNPSTDEWAWISGNTAPEAFGTGPSGVYGTLQTPSPKSVPGARVGADAWTDGAGNLWLFGGQGYDSAGSDLLLNDLWEFNPASNDWTWMAGSSVVPNGCASYLALCGEAGEYGVLQSPGLGNVPGGRSAGASWTDSKGNFWLFGGRGFDAGGNSVLANGLDGYLSDLWEFQPNTNGLPVTATPQITPASGTISSWQKVTITDATAGATISYLVDGLTPAVEYTASITVTSTETIEAIASASGHANSNIATADYEANLSTAATPAFSVAAGNYPSAQTVTISDSTPGASIYFAIGAEPTAAFALYKSPVVVSSSETLQAYAVAENYLYSAVAIAAYSIGSNPPAEWAWMGGTNTVPPGCSSADTCGIPGWYGTLGTPAAANVPGSRASLVAPFNNFGNYLLPAGSAATWSDHAGNLWLFGGHGSDSAGKSGYLNDLWEFNPSSAEWTWMAGSNTIPTCGSAGSCGQAGTYGALGTPSSKNSPGARINGATWTDANGNLWLFGGFGFDANGTLGFLNDLWKFESSSDQWIWLGGSNSLSCTACGMPGTYGNFTVPAQGNMPGARTESLTWTDTNGNFWMFGGFGVDNLGLECYLDDLWEYNASTNQWAWMDGHPTCYGFTVGYQGIYGEVGVPAAGNLPSSYTQSSTWTDSAGHLWLFGGIGEDDTGAGSDLNDMWEFYPSLDEWAFTSTSSGGAPGGSTTSVYGTKGSFSPSNVPGQRSASASWTDSRGNFWVLGGVGLVNEYPVTLGWLNDLWEFKPSLNQWAWMGGSISAPSGTWGATGQYGTLGTPAPVNTPGGRESGAAWTDANGNLWLFGGAAVDGNGTQGSLNDLWEYDLAGSPPVRPPSPAPTPAFSPAAGSYNSAQTVTISDQTAGATIYYTTNGTTPNANSPIYSAPIPVPTSETVEAVSVASGDAVSATAAATYTINLPAVATPAFNPSAGTYSSTQTVTISDTTAGATIYYTTNGSTPTVSSTVYSGAITVPASETIEAIAVASGFANSSVASATYTIILPITFSLSTSPSSLTVNSGSQGSVTLTVTPQNGFSSIVNFGCTGLPGGATCSFSPTTVAPSGGAVTTQVIFVVSGQAAIQRRDPRPFVPTAALALAACLIGWKKRRRCLQLILLAAAFVSLGLISACGGGTGGGGVGGGGTPVTSTVTVVAVSGAIQQTTSILLTVN